jgi:uncharacterized protein YcfJ
MEDFMKMANTRSQSLFVALSLLAGASSAFAGRYDYSAPDVDFARVIEVRPIIQTVHEPVARQECWDEPVTYTSRGHDRGDRAPAVLAGIIGGVIGNQFGHGRGRDAATVAGAALGYAAVRDSQRYDSRYRHEYTRYESRCRTLTEHHRDERVVGYDVAYEYNGRTYWTQTDYHPGDQIEIQVDVRPSR